MAGKEYPAEGFNVEASLAEKIWRPDVYFVHARDSKRHDVITDNLSLNITVQFDNVQWKVKISCQHKIKSNYKRPAASLPYLND